MVAGTDDDEFSVRFECGHHGGVEPVSEFFALRCGARVFLVHDVVEDDEVEVAADDRAHDSERGYGRLFAPPVCAGDDDFGIGPLGPALRPEESFDVAVPFEVLPDFAQEAFGLCLCVAGDADADVRVSQDVPDDVSDGYRGGFSVSAGSEDEGPGAIAYEIEPVFVETE